MTKRIVTFLLAIAMVFAMPISINAAESPIEPQNVNASTALFKSQEDMYFDISDYLYGQYEFTVVFEGSKVGDSKVNSATVYPSIEWQRKLPYGTGTYTATVTFTATYQRKEHYSHGTIKSTYTDSFYYNESDSGYVRIDEHTFSIKEPTTKEDSLGFDYWISFSVEVKLYPPNYYEADPTYGYGSFGNFSVPYQDVINKF